MRSLGGVGLDQTSGWAGGADGLGILTVIVFLFWRGSESPSQESLRFPSLPDSVQTEETIFRWRGEGGLEGES